MFLDPTIVWVMLGALTLEVLVGYPKPIWRHIGHPVSWMGRVISFGESILNSSGRHRSRDLVFGCSLLILLITLVGSVSIGITLLCQQVMWGWAVQLVLCAALLASRSLHDHVLTVATALRQDGLVAGRDAIAQIVGRDPRQLDEAAISRAAIESLAENTSDGIVAPLFWGLLVGLPGIAIYKAVNTADSMIGHRNERYEWFGKTAARLDDFLNFVPARITGFLFVFVATTKQTTVAAFKAMWRDASKHLSPNAGWPEAAMAGSLGCRLGGPRNYHSDEVTEGAWLGDGTKDVSSGDILRALHIYKRSILLIGVMVLVAGAIAETCG